MSSWENDELFPFFENKQLFVNCKDRCFKLFAEGNCVVKAEVEELFWTHKEADSRMLLDFNYILTPSDIVIRTADTDVLIIALGVMDQVDPRKVLWLEAGGQGKNMLQYISITKIFQNLGKKLSRSFLALHALTSCDYTVSYSRKGKMRPLKNLEKKETAQETFGCLGNVEEINESMINVCEEFVCQLCNGKKVKLVNELHFDMFLTKYKTTDEQHLNEVKKMDAYSLPPCQCVLREKIARRHYICRLWRS